MYTRLISTVGLCAALTPLPTAFAGPGHDHGEASAGAPTTGSTPRFVASSDAFELVGLLEGKFLTVYLDHAQTNAPVEKARIELEWAGAPLALKAVGPGEFVATLPQVPADDVISVTATVSDGQVSDLLAADFQLHDHAADRARTQAPLHWQRAELWGAAGALALLSGGLWLRRRKTGPVSSTTASVGGAA